MSRATLNDAHIFCRMPMINYTFTNQVKCQDTLKFQAAKPDLNLKNCLNEARSFCVEECFTHECEPRGMVC